MGIKDVLAVLNEAGPAQPAPPDERTLADYPLNDYGNAKRLIARYGHDLMWIKESGWHIWTGKFWRREQEAGGSNAAMVFAHKAATAIGGEVDSLVAEFLNKWQDMPAPPRTAEIYLTWTMTELRKLSLEMADDVARIRAHGAWKSLSGNHARTESMLKAAAPYLARESDELDSDHFLFNVANGTLHLHDGGVELHSHARENLITRYAPVVYDAKAKCPQFEEFVKTILPDMEVAIFLQTAMGYAMTGDTGEQVMLILHGGGANGKSTFLNCICAATGDYAMSAPVESFLYQERKGGADASPDMARLPPARLVLTSEPEIGARLSESRVKSVTGSEKITTRMLHKGFFEFLPQFKLILSCNSKPTIRGTDHGIWRRIRMVPFTVKIPPEKIVKGIHETYIKEELPGILNWLLAGFRMWEAAGLVAPDAVLASADEYRRESDPIGEFARWALVEKPGAVVPSSELYALYTSWCQRDGFEPCKHALFGRRLGDLEYKKKRQGIIFYDNVSLSLDAVNFANSLHDEQPPLPDDLE